MRDSETETAELRGEERDEYSRFGGDKSSVFDLSAESHPKSIHASAKSTSRQ